MALVNCKECGKKISENAKTCPKCGAKRLKNVSIYLALFWIFLVVGLLLCTFPEFLITGIVLIVLAGVFFVLELKNKERVKTK